MKTLTINNRTFSIAVINGQAFIDGKSTADFIADCKAKKDDIAIKHLLAVAVQVCGGVKCE